MPLKPKDVGERAAETTTAVNSIVGFRRSEVVKSLGLLAGYAAKQPRPFAKHMKNYAGELLEIAKGTSYDDLRNNGGMPSQVDGRPFKVGENLATSKGAVVYKSEMLEIIQYAPQTDKVYKIPLMIIPPQINKFYANDLSPNKSIVKFLTKCGYQVFAVSWRNPTRQHAHWGLENYVQALIDASDALKAITKTGC